MQKGDQKVKVPMEQAIIKPGYNTVKWFFFNHSMEKQNDFVFPPPFQTLTAPAPFADETSCQCRAPHEKLTIAQARLGTPGMCGELHQQAHGHSHSTGSPLQPCINTHFCLLFGSRNASLVSGAIC